MFIFSQDYKERYIGLLTRASEYDKWAHLAGSCTLTILASYFLPVDVAAVSVFAAGVLWEIKDGFYSDGFSFMDIVADIAGILIAVGGLV